MGTRLMPEYTGQDRENPPAGFMSPGADPVDIEAVERLRAASAALAEALCAMLDEGVSPLFASHRLARGTLTGRWIVC